MTRKHKDEIIRWAISPEGTSVWYKNQNNKIWEKTKNPQWLPEAIYIMDDEWAEIRKAAIDGKYIQKFFKEKNRWIDTNYISEYQKKPSDYRIKPKEPKYEWQWIYKKENGDFSITQKYYSTAREAGEKINNSIIISAYELSKREKE